MRDLEKIKEAQIAQLHTQNAMIDEIEQQARGMKQNALRMGKRLDKDIAALDKQLLDKRN